MSTTACPSWCRSHDEPDFHTGNPANDACLAEDIDYTDLTVRTFSIGFGAGSNPGDRPVVDINGSEFELEQAADVGRALLHLSEELTPASELGLRALSTMLSAINEGRGTSHTVESVAESLGMEQPLSVAETSRIARHIGGVLMA
jgi:hypothetical protein